MSELEDFPLFQRYQAQSQAEWMKMMQELNSLLVEAVAAFRVTPTQLGDLSDINPHGHESQEEAYRKMHGL